MQTRKDWMKKYYTRTARRSAETAGRGGASRVGTGMGALARDNEAALLRRRPCGEAVKTRLPARELLLQYTGGIRVERNYKAVRG